MAKWLSALILGICLCLGVPRGAEAANLGELAKYLAFIEGFQHLFEFCQAETKLPDDQVTYARQHIGERRALIFAGLNETQRAKIAADAPAMKKQMLDAMDKRTKKDHPGRPLKELCKIGYFEGVVTAEKESADKERAAILKAKD